MITRETVGQAYPVKPLGDVVEFLDSKRRPVKESERRDGPYPYYGANGQQGTIDAYLFNEPLVLLAEDGGFFDAPERGIAYRVSGKTWVNNHAHVLRPTKYIDVNFLCRVLENYDVTPFISGTTRSKLTKGQAEKIQIPIPNLAEQRRIAAILDQADELRRKRRRSVEQLDVLEHSFFNNLFGDPITNPNRWPEATLRDVTKRVTDGEHLNPVFTESGMPIVMAGNVGDDFVDLSNCKNVSLDNGKKFRTKCCPENGDVLLVSRGATIGRLCYLNVSNEFCLMGSVILIKPNTQLIQGEFLSALLKQPSMHARLYKTSGSSAQQAIYLKDLKRLPCIVPPLALQKKFVSRVSEIGAIKTLYRMHLAKLELLFASLQDRAFRGELTSKTAERELAEAS